MEDEGNDGDDDDEEEDNDDGQSSLSIFCSFDFIAASF